MSCMQTSCFMQVFCRVRPLDGDTDVACVKVISVSTVQLNQPEVCSIFFLHFINTTKV